MGVQAVVLGQTLLSLDLKHYIDHQQLMFRTASWQIKPTSQLTRRGERSTPSERCPSRGHEMSHNVSQANSHMYSSQHSHTHETLRDHEKTCILWLLKGAIRPTFAVMPCFPETSASNVPQIYRLSPRSQVLFREFRLPSNRGYQGNEIHETTWKSNAASSSTSFGITMRSSKEMTVGCLAAVSVARHSGRSVATASICLACINLKIQRAVTDRQRHQSSTTHATLMSTLPDASHQQSRAKSPSTTTPQGPSRD